MPYFQQQIVKNLSKKKKVKLYFVVAGMRKVKTFLPDAYTAADKHLTYTYSFFVLFLM